MRILETDFGVIPIVDNSFPELQYLKSDKRKKKYRKALKIEAQLLLDVECFWRHGYSIKKIKGRKFVLHK